VVEAPNRIVGRIVHFFLKNRFPLDAADFHGYVKEHQSPHLMEGPRVETRRPDREARS